MKQAKKVVIVGAGPGGLAAAMLLSNAGVDVTVVESRGTVGGRTSTIEQEGFKFDTGPTFFCIRAYFAKSSLSPVVTSTAKCR